MLHSLRNQLTSWFVMLFVVLYCVGAILGLFIFDSVLTNQLDEDIRELTSEISPSVDYSSQHPTLLTWADHLHGRHQRSLATIQLFSEDGKLIENYGPGGVDKLDSGTLTRENQLQPVSVRSNFTKLFKGNHFVGYLQVQVSTKQRDQAIHRLGLTVLILAPFFALSVGLIGYFFSAKAVEPVGQTLDLLRRFVADAGHELNTPITVIEASVQTLEQMFKERDMPPDILDVITRASARMKDLSANLMLLARMENPELHAKRLPVNLSETLLPLVEEFKALAAPKQISIRHTIPASLVILAHEDSLRTMVSNLLDNALRYTEPGGTITLSVSGQENTVTLLVEDNGIGIPPESLSHIFERFYRVDKSRSRSVGGSGLGLSIVKAIVDAHKGIIKAESHLGSGTKFTVTLPARS
jgi:signal transduction histidine kinase